VRALDDPENPYLDDYQPWDLWIYTHEQSVLEALGVVNPQVTRDGWSYYSMRVDESGFPVPRLVELKAEYERLKHGRDAAPDEPRCTHSITAMGAMDYGLMLQKQAAEDALRAEYLPEIPEWLMGHQPLWAMILPSGEVVTSEWQNPRLTGPRRYDEESCSRRYSAEGRLLGSTEPGQLWLQLFFDVDGALEKYAGRDVYIHDTNGYLVVSELKTGRTLAVFDLDGSKLPANHPLDDRDGTRFTRIESGDLQRLYDRQRGAPASSV
jgi:hypothetical protein